MPMEFITTDQVTTYTVDANDDVFVLPGVSITSIGNAIQNAAAGVNNGITLTIQGNAYGTTAINLWSTSTENSDTQIYVGQNGHVHATQDAITMQEGDDNVVINHGEISAQEAAVYVQGGEISLSNHGRISSFGSGAQGAVIFNSASFGSNIREITNTGIIDGAPQSTFDVSYATIINVFGAEFHLDNSGSIHAGNADALYSAATENFIANSGLIYGNISITNAAELTNSGVIEGDVSLSGAADTIRNSGLIDGDVALAGGADTYRGIGSGVTVGLVEGAAGNDTLIGGDLDDNLSGGNDEDLLVGHGGDDTLDGGTGADLIFAGSGNDSVLAGSENDTVRGGDGDDTVFGGAGDDNIFANAGDDDLLGEAGNDLIQGGTGNDYIEGGADNDTLTGNADDDTLMGDAGNDLLAGQDGSDVLEGGDNNDTLDGGNGDDVLEGGSGNDILRGRNGEDDLTGGLGRDFLTGGQGADTFVFRALAETEVGANRDQILDFEPGVDLIIVAGLSPGVFEFRGTNAFAPSGNPELRLVETAIGSTIVQLDANGDGAADAEIRVGGVTGLTADDFVL
jgi:Ca2+-binding RTX toxin-like protein